MTTNSVTLELTNKKNSGVTISIFNLAHELARGWIISEEQLDAVDKLLDAVATDDSVTITITRTVAPAPEPPVTVADDYPECVSARELREGDRFKVGSQEYGTVKTINISDDLVRISLQDSPLPDDVVWMLGYAICHVSRAAIGGAK